PAALAARTGQPFLVYGALLCSALLVPTLFLGYIRRGRLLATSRSDLAVTCLLAAALGLPLAMLIERQVCTGPGQLGAAPGLAAIGLVLLRTVLHDALREETGSVSALNPGATGALGPTLPLACGGCGQAAPPGLRYCPRCGVALRAPSPRPVLAG